MENVSSDQFLIIITFQKSNIPVHMINYSPIHLLMSPSLNWRVHVIQPRMKNQISVPQRLVPPLTFNQQVSIKVPHADYVPGATVMEWRHSLTSTAIVFHINLGKHNLCTFWLCSCMTRCFIELWWDFWWICAINSFHTNSKCWTWFKGTNASSIRKANIIEWWQSCINQPVLFFWSPFFKPIFFSEER